MATEVWPGEDYHVIPGDLCVSVDFMDFPLFATIEPTQRFPEEIMCWLQPGAVFLVCSRVVHPIHGDYAYVVSNAGMGWVGLEHIRVKKA